MNTELHQELLDQGANQLAAMDNQLNYDVPENYFSQTKTGLTWLAEKKEQLQVPADYFSSKKNQLKLISTPPNRAKQFSLRPYLSIAASIVLFVMIFFGTATNENKTNTDDYLAYFSPLEQAILNENIDAYFIDSFHLIDQKETTGFDELFSIEEVEPEFFD